MGTSRNDIKRWLEWAKEQGATHLMVVCDTFDYDDYPVYIMPGTDPELEYKARNGVNMQRVMEVYNLSLDFETQLNEHRSFNY